MVRKLAAVGGALAAAALVVTALVWGSAPSPARTAARHDRVEPVRAAIQEAPQQAGQGPLSVTKTPISDVVAADIPVGTVITYNLHIENTIDSRVKLDTVTDEVVPGPASSVASCLNGGPTFKGRGSYINCPTTHTVTQADIDRGSITDLATACGTPEGGTQGCSSGSFTIHLAGEAAEVGLVTAASPPTFFEAGQTITYTYHVTNTGGTPLDDIAVTDSALGPVSCPLSTLAEGESESCTATHITTEADVDAGQITSSAVVTATGRGRRVSHADSAAVDLEPPPGLVIFKSASVPEFGAAGTPVTYQYLVANGESVPLSAVTVTDTRVGPVDCPQTELPAHTDMTCEAEHTVTDADLADGGLDNTATATARTPAGRSVTASDSLRIPADAVAAISVSMTASASSFVQPDTDITYFYDVTNDGNVPLHDVTVRDSRRLAVRCPLTVLSAGQEMECSASRRTTAANIRSGRIDGIATATGRPPSGQLVSDDAELTIPAENAPAVSIVKTASTLDFSRAGQTVTLFYEVTNNGSRALDGLAVTDSSLGRITCPLAVLQPAQQMICTATHTVTSADARRGSLANSARVTATTPTGATRTADADLVLPESPIPDPVSPLLLVVPVTG